MMDFNAELLAQNPLFASISTRQIPALLECLGARRRRYRKGESILQMGQPAGDVGIVLFGSAQILKEDFMGNRTILSGLFPGDLFGEAFAFAGSTSLPVSVLATADCEIMLLGCRKMITTCPDTCSHHAQLIENMMLILAQKNVLLSEKIEILSKRSTQEKLIAYLSACAQASGGAKFQIPFSRQELADYLCVDRSAMTTTLYRLQEEGLIRFSKNRFEILNL